MSCQIQMIKMQVMIPLAGPIRSVMTVALTAPQMVGLIVNLTALYTALESNQFGDVECACVTNCRHYPEFADN